MRFFLSFFAADWFRIATGYKKIRYGFGFVGCKDYICV